MKLNDAVVSWLREANQETLSLIEDMCAIPAPSGMEDKRAAFVKDWLDACGARGVYIDEAKNVLYPINCEGRDDIVLFLAHTDTVFPDTEPMPFTKDAEQLYSPGVGDDTACLAVLLMIAKYVTSRGLKPDCGILIAANSCEEGLGNLKGIRQIMKEYDGRIREVYAFDGQYNRLVTKCVGSHRYRISVETEGGHSFNKFGNANAIAVMSELICRLYACEVPKLEGSKTTYNVGVVSGGTSVNTIAQYAEFMYEYRSDSKECLAKMQSFFESVIAAAQQNEKVKITVETIGIRPCGGDVDETLLQKMSEKCVEISEKYSGEPCIMTSGSTDCNIPMSLGVPAVCVGAYLGAGAHTREESVRIDSIPVGLRIAADLILDYFA